MKKTIIAVNIFVLTLIAQAETKFEIEILKAVDKGEVQNTKRVILKLKGLDAELPPLQVDLPIANRARIVGVKFEKSLVAVVLQFDEFYLEYREYLNNSDKWMLSNSKRICELNGFLSSALTDVQIKQFGEIEVRFGKKADPTKPFNWDKEIVEGGHGHKNDDIVETYSIKKDGSVVKTGDLNRFRGTVPEQEQK